MENEGYIDDITDAIQQHDKNIKAVKGCKIAAAINYDGNGLSDILEMAETNQLDGLQQKYGTQPATGQQILLVEFKDQHAVQWLAVVYDTDELWQDPEIIQLVRR